ncbi:MAG: hypothetical protein AAFX99_17795, partial [Myxococcota bacterium]
VPEDLPLPIPGSCSNDADCPMGSSCTLSVCLPDSLPIPGPCASDNECTMGWSCSSFGICLPFDI